MSTLDDLKFEIRSDPADLPLVRERIRAWTLAGGWSDRDIADVVLAVDEALTNVIRHGYDGAPGQRILVSVRSTDDPVGGVGLEIVIRDYGKQVPIDKISGRDLDDLRPGGLGVHIIRNVMDHVVYRHVEGGGMELCIRKFRDGKEQPDNSGGEHESNA